MLYLTENREMLIRSASEQVSCTRTVEIGQFYVINEFVWEGNRSTFIYAENTQNQGILKIRDYNQFLAKMSRSDQ